MEAQTGDASAIRSAAMDSPHVLMLPFPAQGHIKPMRILAELLTQASFTVSFVNTEHNHSRFAADGGAGISFLSIPDGLPPEHPRTGISVVDLFSSIPNSGKPNLKRLISSMHQRPTVIICDGIMSFAIDVAAELQIPAIPFRTYSATCTWIYFHLQRLIDCGEIPVFGGSEDMESPISLKIAGLESLIRRRDLPHVCRLQPEHPFLQFYINQSSKMAEASALILNTFDELEAPIISHLHSIFPTVYAIGPLHAQQYKTSSSLLLQADNSCMEWLNCQQCKSVLYVSFGSVIHLTKDELMEVWYGLVNSGKKFLWAMRPDLVLDRDEISDDELKKVTEEIGLIVEWAPQEEVLRHDAVGGFLTHCGWNSTLESIAAGKPMICWPRNADQQVNSRCVEKMWGVGLDMKDTCDRSTVAKLVRDLMDGGRQDIIKSVDENACMARESIREGGSSWHNMEKLVKDIIYLNAKITL